MRMRLKLALDVVDLSGDDAGTDRNRHQSNFRVLNRIVALLAQIFTSVTWLSRTHSSIESRSRAVR
jgi:hypothetical protein